MTPQSSFIIQQYEGFGGNFVDSQYLGAAFDASKPHIFENTLMKIYSSKNRFFTDGKLLTKLLSDQGSYGIQEIDTDVYRWTLQGAEKRSAIQMENVESSTTPGLNNTTFRIKLDVNFYHAPDVLFSEMNEYPLQIVDGPIADGTGYVYVVRIQGDDPTVFLPVTNLEPGRRFDKVWTSVASEYFIVLRYLVIGRR